MSSSSDGAAPSARTTHSLKRKRGPSLFVIFSLSLLPFSSFSLGASRACLLFRVSAASACSSRSTDKSQTDKELSRDAAAKTASSVGCQDTLCGNSLAIHASAYPRLSATFCNSPSPSLLSLSLSLTVMGLRCQVRFARGSSGHRRSVTFSAPSSSPVRSKCSFRGE